jgi:hypothetical protein
MEKLAAAEGDVAVAQETVSKSTLSMQSRLQGLQRQLDVNYRAQDSLAKATKTISGARAQGLVDAAEEARLLDLAKQKYTDLVPAVEHVTEGYRLNRMQMMELSHSGRAVFDMLASGQNPMRALEMESMRLVQVMGEGQGGIAGALKALAPIAIPVALAVGAVALGFAGLTTELDKTTGKNISFMETIKATGQAIWSDLTSLVGPAVQKVGSWWGQLIDFIVPTVKNVGNSIINGFKLAYDDSLTAWKMLPAALGDLMLQAANNVVGGLHDMITKSMTEIASWMSSLGPALAVLPGGAGLQAIINGGVSWAATSRAPVIANAYAGANAGINRQLQKNAVTDLTANPMGTLYGQISKFALKDYANDNADAKAAANKISAYQKVTDALKEQIRALMETDRQREIDQELSKAHVTAASAEGQAITKLAGEYYDQKLAIKAVNDAAGFFAQTTESAFEGLITGGQSVTDVLGNMAKALANAVIQAELLGSGPLAGILGTAPTTAGQTGGFFGSILSALHFNATGGVYSGAGISAYSSSVVSHPTVFPFASGVGLMGEAGPEAIMPLKRGADGKLGVAAANWNGGAQNVHVTIGIAADGNGNLTPFVQSVTQQGIAQYDSAMPEKVHRKALAATSGRGAPINKWAS